MFTLKSAAVALLIGLAPLSLAPRAAAQETPVGKSAGAFLIRLRGLAVVPQTSESSITVIGGKVDASTTFDPEVDFSYFLTDNLALELIAVTLPHRPNPV